MLSPQPKTWFDWNYGPVKKEVNVTHLPILEGAIPKDIDGVFVRNGPNPQFRPPGSHHWFEGDGMLHALRIQNGSVSYKNKYVQTESYTYEKKKKTSYFRSLLSMQTIVEYTSFLLSSVYAFVKNAPNPYRRFTGNTHVVYHNKRLFALVETDKPFWIDAYSLDTIQRFDFENQLQHNFTAHPKVDPETGEMFFFCYYAFLNTISYRIASPNSKLSPVVNIPIPVPIMMHDFAITKHYAIFMDLPVVINYKAPILTFDPNKETRFGIFPRYSEDANDIKWFKVKSCYVFHIANAWEEDESIVVVYGCRFPTLDPLFTKVEIPPAYLYQWTFNLTTGEVTERALSDKETEFPSINTFYTGRKSKYFYIGSLENGHVNGVVKFNTETEEEQVQKMGEHRWCGEWVFIPKSEPTSEDDGYLIGYIFDEEKNNSEAIILCAKTLDTLARIGLPQRVPFGFHGAWITKEQMGSQFSS